MNDDAIKSYRAAIDILEKLMIENPALVEYRSALANNYNNLGVVLGRTGRCDDALESHRSAMTFREKLAKENPTVEEFRSDVAISLYNIAATHSLSIPQRKERDRPVVASEAIATLRQAVDGGWRNAYHTNRSKALDPLRDRDDFRKILAEMFDQGFPDNPFAP